MQISFQFDEQLALQAAAYLLKRLGGRVDRIKLMKLLYLADRDHFLLAGRPISGDRLYAMPHGPVPSCTYDALMDNETCVGDPVVKVESTKFVLASDPGDARLSESHRQILDAVLSEHGAKHTWSLREESHRWPEYVECQVGCSSGPIPYEVILKHHAGVDRFAKGRAIITPAMALHMNCPFKSGDADL